MKAKINKNMLQDVLIYCNKKKMKPSFYTIINEHVSQTNLNGEFIYINTSIIEDICKWCEKYNICNDLDNHGNFYFKFKRILDDIYFERKNMYGLYN